MTDFEMRIGPRKSPSPELRPVYQNKTWTRPRYRPPSQTSSPQKRSRGARRRLAPSPSRSDGDPALLLRMDFSPPYPSRSRPADHDIRRKPLSKRIRLPTMEDTRANSLTLGNHRVTTGSDHEIAMRRNPLSINRTPDQSTDNVDIYTPRGQSGGSSVCFSGPLFPPCVLTVTLEGFFWVRQTAGVRSYYLQLASRSCFESWRLT